MSFDTLKCTVREAYHSQRSRPMNLLGPSHPRAQVVPAAKAVWAGRVRLRCRSIVVGSTWSTWQPDTSTFA